MKRNISILSRFLFAFVLFVAIFSADYQVKVQAATVGDILIEPEAGWKRYDDHDANIIYEPVESWVANNYTNQVNYNDSAHYAGIVEAKVKFTISGTKFRIIGKMASTSTKNIEVFIDGNSVGTFSQYTVLTKSQVLCYESSELTDDVHTIELINKEAKVIFIDAIDIIGNLITEQAAPTDISLNKTTLNLSVGQTDKLLATILPADATNKNVIWTSSDNSIASVDTNGVVTGVKVGTAVITATTVDGGLTATCVVNVSEISTGRAVLVVTMSNNTIKEYDLSMTEVDKFITWFNSNSSPSYAITKNYNIKPYTKRTEYLSHDKISSFEVNEYTDN
jgi:uncharacterized protein YjdB